MHKVELPPNRQIAAIAVRKNANYLQAVKFMDRDKGTIAEAKCRQLANEDPVVYTEEDTFTIPEGHQVIGIHASSCASYSRGIGLISYESKF